MLCIRCYRICYVYDATEYVMYTILQNMLFIRCYRILKVFTVFLFYYKAHCDYNLPGGAGFHEDFHTFGLDWTPTYLAFR